MGLAAKIIVKWLAKKAAKKEASQWSEPVWPDVYIFVQYLAINNNVNLPHSMKNYQIRFKILPKSE